MDTANWIVRRIFAWPLAIVGIILVQSGGMLLKTSSWIIDYDYTKDVPDA